MKKEDSKERIQVLARVDPPPPAGPMSPEEDQELLQLESVIRKGRNVFLAVGHALAQIRDKGLYRMKYRSFHQYYAEELGYDHAHVYRLMAAAATHLLMGPLEEAQEPATERLLRPLYDLKPEVVRPVWLEILKTANGAGVKLKTVEQIAEKYRPKEKARKSARRKKASRTPEATRRALELLTQIEEGFRLGCVADEWMRWTEELRQCLHAA